MNKGRLQRLMPRANRSSILRLENFDAAFLPKGFKKNVTRDLSGERISGVFQTRVLSGNSSNGMVVDVSGLTAILGRIDAHAHLLSLRNREDCVDLSNAKSISQVVRVLQQVCESSLTSLGYWAMGGIKKN